METEQDEPQTILTKEPMSRKEEEKNNAYFSSPWQDVHNKGHIEGTPGRGKENLFIEYLTHFIMLSG